MNLLFVHRSAGDTCLRHGVWNDPWLGLRVKSANLKQRNLFNDFLDSQEQEAG
jgi:hypothetical protein